MLSGLNEDLAFPMLLPRPKIGSGPFYSGVRGRTVLITGAGGSIGSELALQVAASRPKKIILADSSEGNLYEIDSTIGQGAPDLDRVSAVLDVRDMPAVRRLFSSENPDIVFHAAALKHVPLLETPHNTMEAVLTNLGGTINITDTSLIYGAEMVFISTDKAVSPSSIMGTTKRLAELYVHGLASYNNDRRLSQVRFGNVLGSSGSVVPLFRRQIAQGGPVTVTHPDMTRYMMSIKEAVSLVLNSSEAHDSDGYGLYILDMGEPVKILDLAEQLIRFAGLQPHTDIPIEYIGLRPGEKMHEELVYPWERLTPTKVARVNMARPMLPADMFVGRLRRLKARALERNYTFVRDEMNEILMHSIALGEKYIEITEPSIKI
ncbi:polysaccharide biosynthesis protein [Shinella sp.]|uniref:polysaccharide biosynthesis protein n=1 Tax=Shinella sp. TaxID=1870904 RepID=UPI0039E531AB